MSDNWYIEEYEEFEGAGFSWNLYRCTDGKAKCVAQILDQAFSEDILEIIKWREALMVGEKMLLSTLEQPIDVNTGKPWVRDPNLKSYDIRITKTRKPRA